MLSRPGSLITGAHRQLSHGLQGPRPERTLIGPAQVTGKRPNQSLCLGERGALIGQDWITRLTRWRPFLRQGERDPSQDTGVSQLKKGRRGAGHKPHQTYTLFSPSLSLQLPLTLLGPQILYHPTLSGARLDVGAHLYNYTPRFIVRPCCLLYPWPGLSWYSASWVHFFTVYSGNALQPRFQEFRDLATSLNWELLARECLCNLCFSTCCPWPPEFPARRPSACRD